mmetsp:Transcript_43145/g.106541  ORF Transcript_43145/g.106541 Transcript_43145/m.106541 type:complete len:318 (+) Transcript_43145:72-1025(+)
MPCVLVRRRRQLRGQAARRVGPRERGRGECVEGAALRVLRLLRRLLQRGGERIELSVREVVLALGLHPCERLERRETGGVLGAVRCGGGGVAVEKVELRHLVHHVRERLPRRAVLDLELEVEARHAPDRLLRLRQQLLERLDLAVHAHAVVLEDAHVDALLVEEAEQGPRAERLAVLHVEREVPLPRRAARGARLLRRVERGELGAERLLERDAKALDLEGDAEEAGAHLRAHDAPVRALSRPELATVEQRADHRLGRVAHPALVAERLEQCVAVLLERAQAVARARVEHAAHDLQQQGAAGVHDVDVVVLLVHQVA